MSFKILIPSTTLLIEALKGLLQLVNENNKVQKST